MKASRLELDPEGDVELVLALDKSATPRDAELGWLITDSKKYKKRKDRRRRRATPPASPPPPDPPAAKPEPPVVKADPPAAEPEPVPSPDPEPPAEEPKSDSPVVDAPVAEVPAAELELEVEPEADAEPASVKSVESIPPPSDPEPQADEPELPPEPQLTATEPEAPVEADSSSPLDAVPEVEAASPKSEAPVEPEVTPKAEVVPEPDPTPQPEPAVKAEEVTEPEPAPEPEPVAEPEAALKSDGPKEPEAVPKSDTPVEPELVPKAEKEVEEGVPEPKPDAEPDVAVESEPTPKAEEVPPEPKEVPKADDVVEPEPVPEAEFEVVTKSEASVEPDAAPDPEVAKAVPDAEAVAEEEPEAEAKSIPESEHVPKAEAVLEVVPEPEAAPVNGIEKEPTEEPAVAVEETARVEPATNGVTVETPLPSPVSQAEGTPSTVSEDDDVQLRLVVSSRHLSLASPVFRNLLKEAGDGQSPKVIRIHGWDPEALLIVMDVIHGHHREVPRSVSLATLVNIALIVEYFQCHEILEIFGQIWLVNLEESHPSFHGKESIVFLFLAWVFSDNPLFKKMTELAILKCEGPLNTMLLPIPDSVLDDILNKRLEHVTKLLDALYEAQALLLVTDFDSTFERSSMLLGSLLKEMHRNGLPISRPDSSFWRSSVYHLGNVILGLKTPRPLGAYDWDPDYHLEAPIIAALGELEGLDLDSYGP